MENTKITIDFILTRDVFSSFDESVFDKVRAMQVPQNWSGTKAEFEKFQKEKPDTFQKYKSYIKSAPITYIIGIYKNAHGMMIQACAGWFAQPLKKRVSERFPATVEGFNRACEWVDKQRQDIIQIIANGKL